ncbi:MAG: hypothetical protein GY814_04045, partial [Gammaproteobacteria bacterium]|nr:hypothetical protein [Gammaproteobacteria bacterium]
MDTSSWRISDPVDLGSPWMDPYSEQHIQDPGILVLPLSSTSQLSCYSMLARALQRALCMHAVQHDSTGVLHPSGMLHPDPYSRPYHPITWSGGLASSVTTALRIVALQGPSRGTPAATSVARGERREPAAHALRDLVPGDLQHLASRDSQGLQTLRLSG